MTPTPDAPSPPPLDEVPLTALLSWVWTALTIETDNAAEAAGRGRLDRQFRISLPMWANGLRGVAEDGVTVARLRATARAACNLGGLERWGWISVGAPPERGRRRPGYGTGRGIEPDTMLWPTRAGRLARELWPRAVAEVEERWRSRWGGDVVAALQRALLPLVDDGLPWSPPEVAPSNGFRSEVPAREANDRGGSGASTGAATGSTGRALPLVVLPGQVLTSFTLGHEASAAVSLPLGADVLRAIGREASPVPLRDLPRRSGVSKEAMAMGLTHLRRTGLGETSADRSVALTAKGCQALDDYRARAGEQVAPDLRHALLNVVSAGGGARLGAGLAPPPGCWRGERPYLAQTQRLMARPLGSLPWHPMVLHRGGWPDGS